MFIKLDDYVISVDTINFIKIVGSGVKIGVKFQQDPITIANVPERDLELAFDKLFLRRKELK